MSDQNKDETEQSSSQRPDGHDAGSSQRRSSSPQETPSPDKGTRSIPGLPASDSSSREPAPIQDPNDANPDDRKRGDEGKRDDDGVSRRESEPDTMRRGGPTDDEHAPAKSDTSRGDLSDIKDDGKRPDKEDGDGKEGDKESPDKDDKSKSRADNPLDSKKGDERRNGEGKSPDDKGSSRKKGVDNPLEKPRKGSQEGKTDDKDKLPDNRSGTASMFTRGGREGRTPHKESPLTRPQDNRRRPPSSSPGSGSKKKKGHRGKPLKDEDEGGILGGNKPKAQSSNRNFVVTTAVATGSFAMIMVFLLVSIIGGEISTTTSLTPALFGDDCIPADEAEAQAAAQNVSKQDNAKAPDDLPESMDLPSPAGTADKEQVKLASQIVSAVEGSDISDTDKASVIALMTAWQESTMKNLEGGDADSQGLFQQRPSAGWGSSEEIRDPKKSTLAFLGLADHTDNPGLNDVKGWEKMDMNDAAQKVQASGHPDAYTKWESASKKMFEELTGKKWTGGGGDGGGSSPDKPICDDDSGSGGESVSCPATDFDAEDGLKPDAKLVLRCIAKKWPEIKVFHGVGGRGNKSDHPSGRAVDAMISSAEKDYKSDKGVKLGTDIAEWVMNNHKELGVKYVIWNAKIWSDERGEKPTKWENWRDYSHPSGGSDDTLLHRDHPHVSVYGDKATGFDDDDDEGGGGGGDGEWSLPLKKGSYAKTSGFGPRTSPCAGCSSYHQGQDLGVPTGNNVMAVADGKVIRAGISGSLSEGFGNLVVVDHGGGIHVYYPHLSEIKAKEGQKIKRGEVLGKSGATGGVTGPHLHLEIRVDGTAKDPVPIMKKHGAPL